MDRKVFYNGTILTMQAEGHTVEAVYTIGDRIAAIGNRDDVFRQITDDTERVDLEGKTLIPGFIESHAHVTDWAECEFLQFTCYHIKNIAELQDMIRENAKTKKAGEWVIGYGYNDSMVAEMRHLERADIDAACADHPVFVMHGSGHLAYVNSKALEICNIHADTPIPAGGQGEIHLGADGLPSGLLIGQAYNLALSVIPKYTVEEYKGAFRKGIAAANAKGVCSIGDGSIGYMGNQWQLLRAFHELEKEGDLNLRFYLVIMDYGYIPFMEGGLVTGFGSESLQLGSIKLLLDGSIQGRTASVKEPYLGTDEKGLLHHTPEDLQARVELGDRLDGYVVAAVALEDAERLDLVGGPVLRRVDALLGPATEDLPGLAHRHLEREVVLILIGHLLAKLDRLGANRRARIAVDDDVADTQA